MNNKICIYAICKNEKQFVEKWLESMSEADYIAVLDTGSTDGTYELLQDFAKNEYRGKLILDQKIITPWRFDKARNESLKLVPKDTTIYFCTDLDELLDSGWSQPLKENWVDGFHERCSYKYAWSHLEDDITPRRIFYYDKIHSKDWEWEYPVHETLHYIGSNQTIKDSFYYNTLNLFDKIYLHHHADPYKSRSNYLPLLELRVQEAPNDCSGKIYLAHEYFYRGKYENSIATLYNILNEHSNISTSLEKANYYLFLGDNYKALEDFEESERMYLKAIDEDPTYREPYLNLAVILINKQSYTSAVKVLKDALNKTYRHYSWLERDISWSYELYDLLSLASYYRGDKKDALAYAAKAVHECPNSDRLIDNVNIIIQNMDEKDFI